MLVQVGPVAYTAGKLQWAIGMYSRRFREEKEGRDRSALVPCVTDPDLLDTSGEKLRVYEPDASGAFAVEYDMPLDGAWSDLTASFVLLPSPNGYDLGLYDMHVL
ncbi:MAG TPA: hypothetical protein VEO54_14465 [Thermoanaerobaculia bacterium]|nr:hypothetical protein [Thermoanaerobaculia bacterium]